MVSRAKYEKAKNAAREWAKLLDESNEKILSLQEENKRLAREKTQPDEKTLSLLSDLREKCNNLERDKIIFTGRIQQLEESRKELQERYQELKQDYRELQKSGK
jgi:hypothetical protein